MSSKPAKIAVSLAVIGGAIGYLFYATSSNAFEYFKHVDEVLPEAAQWRGKPLQLHGYVLPGSIQKRLGQESGRMEYKFREVNCGKEVEVFLTGTVPDTFKDGAEVIAKGELKGDSFHATEVTAKCPSKYEAQDTARAGHPTGVKAAMCARGTAN